MAQSSPSSSSSSSPDPAPPGENPHWTQDRRASRDRVANCLEVLRSACVPGGDDVGEILRHSDRSFDLGVYLHNPFSRNGWVREVQRAKTDNIGRPLFGNEGTGKFVVITGDASHAMPPFLGQGANQALQE